MESSADITVEILRAIRLDIGGLAARLDTMDARMASRMEALEGRMEAFEGRMDRLTTRVDQGFHSLSMRLDSLRDLAAERYQRLADL